MTVLLSMGVASVFLPQWSPLLVSGMTHRSPRLRPRALPAAMEPAPGERDDAEDETTLDLFRQMPQWSPLLVSGMTCPTGAGPRTAG